MGGFRALSWTPSWTYVGSETPPKAHSKTHSKKRKERGGPETSDQGGSFRNMGNCAFRAIQPAKSHPTAHKPRWCMYIYIHMCTQFVLHDAQLAVHQIGLPELTCTNSLLIVTEIRYLHVHASFINHQHLDLLKSCDELPLTWLRPMSREFWDSTLLRPTS